MDTEFHYWVTGLIALRAGFTPEESQIIAYSSEYVDENDVSIEVKSKRNGKKYSNYISQTMNILKPKSELMRIYPVFHFIPGEPEAESAARRDGKMHLLNTTPNSDNAKNLLDGAFKSTADIRPYRIGVASHSYVDTWAHQNFVGWYDYFNNIGLDIKPDIGHADAEFHPDWMSHKWVDNRLVQADVNNQHRFLSAAKGLFESYCTYQKNDSEKEISDNWTKLQNELIDLMGQTYTGDLKRYEGVRLERYKALTGFAEFDENLWFNQAIKTDVKGLPDSKEGMLSLFTVFKDDYYWKEDKASEDTNWYKFQEAVKEHEKFALKLLQPTFTKMGINLSQS